MNGARTARDGAAGPDAPPDREYVERLAQLRGALAPRGLTARDLAQLARNPRCDRLLVHRAARLDPAAVVGSVFGEQASDEGSRLAFATGVTFERVLLKNGGAPLFEMFRAACRLRHSDDGLAIVDAVFPGNDPVSLARREAHTRELLLRKLAGDPDAPSIIWHPRLTLDVDGERVAIVPDLLAAASGDRFYRPGEVKAYRDRGPRTSASDLATARLQGAVEILALRHTLRCAASESGASLPANRLAELVPDRLDLILRARYGMRPSLRSVAVRREVATMSRIVSEIRGRMLSVLAAWPAGAALDTADGHRAVPNHLTESCREHCAFAAYCEAQARAAGAPIVLGEAMAEAVGIVGSLTRLADLVAGRDHPRSDDERRVARGFRQAHVISQREVQRAG